MTEIQKLNETPLSQAIKAIILPRNRIETGLYFFLWIRDVLSIIEAWNVETELTAEELANLEAMTFLYDENDVRQAYLQMTEPIGEVAEVIYPVPELMLQIMKIQNAILKNEPENTLMEHEIALLEMLAANLNNNDGIIDLAPSLHESSNLCVYPFADVLNHSYERLMGRLAEPIVKRIVGSVKRNMQRLDRNSGMMQSEEDSCLGNVWDEFCVEVQGQQSLFYELYLDYIEKLVFEKINECSKDETIILWTQTQGYDNWSLSEPDCDYSDILFENYVTDEVCEYLLQKIIEAADNFSSNRIDEYLFR